MLRSSALYMVIIVALVIAILCSSLIVGAYYYRLQSQQYSRYDRLSTNVKSGITILLSSADTSFLKAELVSLSDNNIDSVSLYKLRWGIFDVGISKAFIQHDSLFSIFSFANTIDSSRWAVLYIPDKKGNLAFSGNTYIKGQAFIPKGGIVAASVDRNAYVGDKKFIVGKIKNSAPALPILDASRLITLKELINNKQTVSKSTTIGIDSLSNSFSLSTKIFDLGKAYSPLKNIKLSGNIIIRSDTTVKIDSTAKLNNVIIVARSVIIEEGFRGNCQIFAIDSIDVEQNCVFSYPSCLSLLRFSTPVIGSAQKLTIGDNVQFSGLIFTYESSPGNFNPLMTIGKSSKIKGQIYLPGGISVAANSEIDGGAFVNFFLYQTPSTKYTNNLVNIRLDESALSSYYLSSSLMPVTLPRKRILEWLEKN